MSWPGVPAGQASGPASSTKRKTFFHCASVKRATALKSGSQLAAQPISEPSGLLPRQARRGAPATAVKVAPPLVDSKAPPALALALVVATRTVVASRTTTFEIDWGATRTSVKDAAPSVER